MIELELSKKKSLNLQKAQKDFYLAEKNIMAFCTTLLHKVPKFHFLFKKYFT